MWQIVWNKVRSVRATNRDNRLSVMFDNLHNSNTSSPPTSVLLFLIRMYQIFLSPLFGTQCRFYPSCSHYAQQALKTHGCIKGGMLTLSRICRCNPYCEGGIDHVPPLLNLERY